MSDDKIVQSNCKIVNKQGLHTRSAAAIVEVANRYQCSITIGSDKGESDARDMIRLILLEASKGTEVSISAKGENATKAVIAMKELIDAGFYEQEDEV
ncbi:MAG: HPr family phosphocarrier protein [Gammaproteobacteria bacterium]|nr:HPr family phosphocarrier protein [Gammaproteobacteria bacterium]